MSRGALLVSLGAVLLPLMGCASPRAPSGSGAIVLAGEATPRLQTLIDELEPRVISVLGARSPRTYRVFLGEIELGRGEYREAYRRLTIAPGSLDEDLHQTVAHELAHVHSVGRWAELPPCVEEGLACWVTALALGETDG